MLKNTLWGSCLIFATFLLFSCRESKEKSHQTTYQDSSLVLSPANPAKARSAAQPKPAFDLLQLPRMNVAALGCLLEKKLDYRDSTFNCDLKNYQNQGDPCRNTEAYYEGPVFNNAYSAGIHPLFSSVQFEYEHGQVREVVFHFVEDVPIKEVEELLALPQDRQALPANVMAISYSEDSKLLGKTKWVSLMGFEHQGAGEVDCNGAGE